MLANLKHPAAQRTHSAKRLHDAKAKGDPTGTLSIRRNVMHSMDRRWAGVARSVREVVVGANMLGLNAASAPLNTPFNLASFMSMSAVPNAGKIRGFQRWFDDQLATAILSFDAAYIRPSLVETYSKAMLRATRLAGLTEPPKQVINDIGANIDTLQQFFVIELQGIMEATSQRAVRAATEGILQRLRPAPVSRTIKVGIQAVGVIRTRALVQALIVRAHSEGTLDTFEAAGVKKVGLLPETIFRPRLRDAVSFIDARRKAAAVREAMVEILTAGDNDVCPVCEDLSVAGPYTISDARGLIPAHPNCRCAFVPADDARFSPVAEEDDA